MRKLFSRKPANASTQNKNFKFTITMNFIILTTVLSIVLMQMSTAQSVDQKKKDCSVTVNCYKLWTKEECVALDMAWVPETPCSCSYCEDCGAEIACKRVVTEAECQQQGKVVIPKSKCECSYCGPVSAQPVLE